MVFRIMPASAPKTRLGAGAGAAWLRAAPVGASAETTPRAGRVRSRSGDDRSASRERRRDVRWNGLDCMNGSPLGHHGTLLACQLSRSVIRFTVGVHIFHCSCAATRLQRDFYIGRAEPQHDQRHALNGPTRLTGRGLQAATDRQPDGRQGKDAAPRVRPTAAAITGTASREPSFGPDQQSVSVGPDLIEDEKRTVSLQLRR